MWKNPFYPFSADQHFLLLFTILNCFSIDFHWFSPFINAFPMFLHGFSHLLMPLQRPSRLCRGQPAIGVFTSQEMTCLSVKIREFMWTSWWNHAKFMVKSWWVHGENRGEHRVKLGWHHVQWQSKTDRQKTIHKVRWTIVGQFWLKHGESNGRFFGQFSLKRTLEDIPSI